MTVTDIIAQMPLNMRFNLSKETKMGNQPLVPYFTNLKPQKNGEVLVEVEFSYIVPSVEE